MIVLITGIIIHALFTGRLPLVAAWVGGFICKVSFAPKFSARLFSSR